MTEPIIGGLYHRLMGEILQGNVSTNSLWILDIIKSSPPTLLWKRGEPILSNIPVLKINQRSIHIGILHLTQNSAVVSKFFTKIDGFYLYPNYYEIIQHYGLLFIIVCRRFWTAKDHDRRHLYGRFPLERHGRTSVYEEQQSVFGFEL